MDAPPSLRPKEWVLVNRTSVAGDVAGGPVRADAPGGPGGIETVAIPVRGGEPRKLCAFNCLANSRWSPDSRWIFLGLEQRRTLVLHVAVGRVVGPAPFIGLISESSYIFLKTELRRNLFRIQLR
jgi:hypothetical protein